MGSRTTPDATGVGTLAIAGSGDEHALVQRFRLEVVAGDDAGASFESSGERAVIGTHESADCVLHDATVSRLHCEIAPRDGRLAIRDLGSRNGTVVDGVSVVDAYLRDGSLIHLGRSQLRVHAGDDSLRLPLSKAERFGIVVGRSVAMRRTFALLERAAQSDVTVLLEGETGTGKEAVAESVHRESARRNGPLVVVDCGAVPADLLESELFGHERGAFTGAAAARQGAFEAAAGGTIFLDEIGELEPDLQPKLLRALERREVKRVGSNKYAPVDVRVIAATNRDLCAEVNKKTFRADLYYRLAVLRVRLPPLRERLEDLPLLVDHLLDVLGAKDDPESAPLRSERFLASLARHAWLGNVRELRNHVERCLALRTEAPFDDAPTGDAPTAAAVDLSKPIKEGRENALRAYEAAYVKAMLAKHGGSVVPAAREAGVDRTYFYRLMWRAGIR